MTFLKHFFFFLQDYVYGKIFTKTLRITPDL